MASQKLASILEATQHEHDACEPYLLQRFLICDIKYENISRGRSQAIASELCPLSKGAHGEVADWRAVNDFNLETNVR